jgi:hypothetical protein
MTTMSAAQLIIMAVIVVALMAVWLTLVFLADREPRRPDRAPAGTSPDGRAGAASPEGTALVPPPRPPGDQEAVPGEQEKALQSGVASRA